MNSHVPPRTAVQSLAMLGCIVEKDVVKQRELGWSDLEILHRLAQPPLVVNETLLKELRGISPDLEYVQIRMIDEFPAFTGVDGAVFAIERGAVAELPEANAEVLVGQGRAEMV